MCGAQSIFRIRFLHPLPIPHHLDHYHTTTHNMSTQGTDSDNEAKYRLQRFLRDSNNPITDASFPPPPRPSSALSGSGGSFVNNSESEGDESEDLNSPFTLLPPRLRASTIRRDGGKCVACGATEYLDAIRLTGLKKGELEVSQGRGLFCGLYLISTQ